MIQSKLLHIFRNTPLGRETFLQSIYFSRALGVNLNVYIPKTKKFLMYFEHDTVQVDLDDSYMSNEENAVKHVRQILEMQNFTAEFVEPEQYTASNLPDLPTDYEYMTCPRSISDKVSKLGLGHIGSKVRSILNTAVFPVLIPSTTYKEWQSVAVLFGGSQGGLKALETGLKLGRDADRPVDVITSLEKDDKEGLERIIAENNLRELFDSVVRQWLVFESGDFVHNLYAVPHDALLVLGAYGHGLVRELLFGSRMEIVQSHMPNSLLIVGPNYTTHQHYGEPAGKVKTKG